MPRRLEGLRRGRLAATWPGCGAPSTSPRRSSRATAGTSTSRSPTPSMRPSTRTRVAPARRRPASARATSTSAWSGQDTDVGLVRVEIEGKDRFKLTQSGTRHGDHAQAVSSPPAPSSRPSTSPASRAPSTRTSRRPRSSALPTARSCCRPGRRRHNWLDAAEANAEPTLDAIHAFLGHDIPGEGPVIIRQAPTRSLGGYASAHDTPGIVQLDESAGSRRRRARAGTCLVRDGQLHRALAARGHGRVDRHDHGRGDLRPR